MLQARSSSRGDREEKPTLQNRSNRILFHPRDFRTTHPCEPCEHSLQLRRGRTRPCRLFRQESSGRPSRAELSTRSLVCEHFLEVGGRPQPGDTEKCP